MSRVLFISGRCPHSKQILMGIHQNPFFLSPFPQLLFLLIFLLVFPYYFYTQETLKTLEINDNNQSLATGYWKNPKSGNNGVIKIKGYYGQPNCRLIEHIYINSNNVAQNSYDTACREESGKWAMIK